MSRFVKDWTINLKLACLPYSSNFSPPQLISVHMIPKMKCNLTPLSPPPYPTQPILKTIERQKKTQLHLTHLHLQPSTKHTNQILLLLFLPSSSSAFGAANLAVSGSSLSATVAGEEGKCLERKTVRSVGLSDSLSSRSRSRRSEVV